MQNASRTDALEIKTSIDLFTAIFYAFAANLGLSGYQTGLFRKLNILTIEGVRKGHCNSYTNNAVWWTRDQYFSAQQNRQIIQEIIKKDLVDQVLAESIAALPEIEETRRAMMLFTSGTTNKPKGVVSTHKTIRAQITTLIDAWEWSEDDVIPLFLPLHHIHGIIDILSCCLYHLIQLFSDFNHLLKSYGIYPYS